MNRAFILGGLVASSVILTGTPAGASVAKPGDLLFFYSPVSHVGMYIGNGQMVHASTSGVPVKMTSPGSSV